MTGPLGRPAGSGGVEQHATRRAPRAAVRHGDRQVRGDQKKRADGVASFFNKIASCPLVVKVVLLCVAFCCFLRVFQTCAMLKDGQSRNTSFTSHPNTFNQRRGGPSEMKTFRAPLKPTVAHQHSFSQTLSPR